MEQRYRNELRCRCRREGESLRELAQNIQGLMTLAYPGKGDSHIGQHIAMDSFLTALANPDLQMKVRDRDPDTLEEAVKLALRFETTRSAIESSVSSRQRVVRRVEEPPSDIQQFGTEVSTAPRRHRLTQSDRLMSHSAGNPGMPPSANVTYRGKENDATVRRRRRILSTCRR